MAFTLRSNDLKDGDKMPQQQVFNGMGYSGENLSPHLAWDGVPEGTKSFAITVYDPDAPTGSGWWHWGVANIPADVRELATGAGSGKGGLPEGAAQTRTDFGKAGYGGAAPPKTETHRYQFTVHALDVDHLEVDENTSGAMLGFNLHHHSLGKASLTVTFN
ncbi:kinase inhibitor [Chimaeribacter arupi]|jgi:Raf kinase inhibitor-like YbhB/YbcL family protein|uniref:Kinase inhibitor n=2 Tax=Yersiniaceae TaxID=1903411 RepID=A0A2N5EMB7_9GAMM|nr:MULTISPECIES: kinase inhibitor [Yersiniaceae]MBS0969578.1 kinase inhibitor [Nissabacter archeti]MDV5142317.1 kinase inhibitor [Chimaeribacter arupi]PLR48471.1 kinase inhibitor [Chimaeribacter arupi]PLR48940.1 kinase inhibitor [Chimaeribacter arupi]WKZ91327.1 kinase inhibitor [Chimaeribacter arupi]